jgi:hypothetical protein
MATQSKHTKRTLSGTDLRGMIDAGKDSLEANVDLVNSINVFPVPDGDTGTNMFLTIKSAITDLENTSGADQFSKALAKGTLMGARGNSGVILSQYFKGWADSLEGRSTLDASQIAMSLVYASHEAYKAVSEPKEGTILTVMKAAADGAEHAIKANKNEPEDVWGEACDFARIALEATPDLLPILKEAGVVDSGGLGFLAIIEGALAYLKGESVKPLEVKTGQLTLGTGYLTSTEEGVYGYCTQFLIHGAGLNLDSIREKLNTIADSVVVVGDDSTLKLHVHTYDPGGILTYGVSLGTLAEIKVDNMDQQHQDFIGLNRQPDAKVDVGVVAVVSGAGLQRLFRNLGCIALVHGGQTMNPSAQELMESVSSSSAASVIVLPNNSNIVNTALQAEELSDKDLHVVQSRTVPEGIAALLAFNPELDLENNLTLMEDAMTDVRSAEITTAIRSTSINGISVTQGQHVAVLEGKIVSVADTIAEVVRDLFTYLVPTSGSLVTLYWGGDVIEENAIETSDWIKVNFPEVEVEVAYGGQPLYHYLVSLE